MQTVRIVVTGIEADPPNADGGRTITIGGTTFNDDIGHCVLTFADAAALDQLRRVIDSK